MATNWDALPQLLTVDDLAALLRTTPKGIYQRWARRTLAIRPVQCAPVLLWNKDHWRALHEGRRVPLGFLMGQGKAA
jgi:hypothetical protein